MDDDEFQLKGLLSSFMGPNHPHSPLLVGYFSKLRKLLKVYHGVDGKKGGGRRQANLTPWKERPCKWRHQVLMVRKVVVGVKRTLPHGRKDPASGGIR
ncbi:hypothetical protein C5167_049373 [Papaver somniferum]|uniref:Uncharacterized protein n=1 Tax=Papaver somniferum TaxID=3469 RepID=A0A4Y7KND9_PAPSO|nr:hypothetical protein C5167_049373 [Papaver somniferum]